MPTKIRKFHDRTSVGECDLLLSSRDKNYHAVARLDVEDRNRMRNGLLAVADGKGQNSEQQILPVLPIPLH
jgi:hypothetical protein